MSSTDTSALDKILALDLLKDSKFGITGLAKASTETSHLLLRNFIDTTLNECIEDHFRLTDLLMTKGWYHPGHTSEQLEADVSLARQLQNSNHFPMT